MRDLKMLHWQVEERMVAVKEEEIWKGFVPGKFALYDEEQCFFDGEYMAKPVDFCANTALKYGGEYIAIWDVSKELSLPLLTAKIVHELFHAFQMENWAACWSNEMEAIFQYEYSEESLSLKRRENRLLTDLVKDFQQEKWEEVLALRSYREKKFPYEFRYESCVEEIEGTATYVEWVVLGRLDAKLAMEERQKGITLIQDPENYFPVRFSSYYSGALRVMVWQKAGGSLEGQQHSIFTPEVRKMMEERKMTTENIELYQKDKGIAEALQKYQQETKEKIDSALFRNEVVLTGPAKLRSVNVFDARRQGNYIISRFFLMYRMGEEDKVLNESVVIKMKDEKTIEKVYKLL